MKNNLPPFTDQLIAELEHHHHCHTIILYGSWARGDVTATSDIDVVGIRDDGDAYRIGRPWQNMLLDAWVYGASNLPKPDQLLHLKDGVVLTERDNSGTELLQKIREALSAPVKPMLAWDREHRVTWIEKMLARAAVGDVEGNFRLHWLLFDLLETWFNFSGLRYLGAKQGLKHLEKNEPNAFNLFEAALKPGAGFEAVEKLARAVSEVGK